MVSSNHNEKVSEIIAKVLSSVGLDGMMNIVESPTGLTNFKLVNGLIFNRGLTHAHFVEQTEAGSKNPIEQSVELEHPLVLVVADKIASTEDILPILEIVKQAKKPFVLFSQDLRDEPASMMVYNMQKGIV